MTQKTVGSFKIEVIKENDELVHDSDLASSPSPGKLNYSRFRPNEGANNSSGTNSANVKR